MQERERERERESERIKTWKKNKRDKKGGKRKSRKIQT